MSQVPAAEEDQGPGPILVIEDDRPTRELLATILSEESLPFHLCATGHEALDYARREPPAMVVLDMHLPSLQGEAVATTLQIEFGQRLPILVMSAGSEGKAAAQFGAFSYLQKPFEIDAFLADIRRARRSSAA